MRTVTKTVEVLESFVDEFYTQGWNITAPSYTKFGSDATVDVVSVSTGISGTIPVSQEFIEELRKRKYGKFQMEIKFLDNDSN